MSKYVLSLKVQSNLRRATTQGKMQKWLLFAGSVVGAMNQSYVYSIPDPCIPMCYKPNIYDIEFFTLTNKSILYEENMTH